MSSDQSHSDKSPMDDLIGKLKQYRDEVAVKIHLGGMDAKTEFGKAKEKLDKLAEDYAPVKHAAAESADNVLASLQLVGEELVKSFERIRKSL